MIYDIYIFSSLLGLFITLFVILNYGQKIGLRHLSEDPSGQKMGVGQVEGSIFALLGLLIAFTFYGASQRFDLRRQMLVNESNAIGTAWLRIDLISDELQPKMRDLFRQYTNARLDVTRKLPDITASSQQENIANDLQSKIWDLAILDNKNATVPITMSVLPSLNAMFDIATAHNISLHTHPPTLIYLTLILLICITSFFVGYSLAGLKRRYWLHGIGYISVVLGILFLIIDYEYPRLGLIKISTFDQSMIELRDKMNH